MSIYRRWKAFFCLLFIPAVDRWLFIFILLFCRLASTGRSSTWVTEISTVNGLVAPPCEIHQNIERQQPHPNSPATGPATPVRGIQHLPHILPPPPPAPSCTSSAAINASAQVATANASPYCSPGRSIGTVEHDERIWSEILERSLSSSSLHHLQRLHRSHSDEDDDNVGNGNRSIRMMTDSRASSYQDKRRNGNPPGNWHVWNAKLRLWISRTILFPPRLKFLNGRFFNSKKAHIENGIDDRERTEKINPVLIRIHIRSAISLLSSRFGWLTQLLV